MSRGNGPGWLFLGVMIALLIGISFALLPEHTDMFMISAMSWAWIVLVGSMTLACGRTWRWVDLLKRGD